MYLLYSSLLAIGFLISIPYWAFQMLRHGKYGSGLGERLGRVASRLMIQQSASVIWVHAVSVGEVQAVTELISGLRQKFSQHRVVISGAGLRSIQSPPAPHQRSEEHTSELQSRLHLVCRLLLVNNSNLKLLRRITRTENILHRNFTRRQVAIQNRVASNIGIRQSTFSVKVLNLFSRSRRKTNKRKSKHSAMFIFKETRHRMFIGLFPTTRKLA